MSWTAPEVVELDEVFVADETTLLRSFLATRRRSLLRRCGGLDGDQLAHRSVPPSVLSLLGLLRHLADVERAWFRRRLAGLDLPMLYSGTDACFHDAVGANAERDYELLVREWQSVDAVLGGADLDQTFVHPEHGTMSLRWTYQHVLHEYAGHLGHADLLRERLDGRTFG